MEQQLRRPPQIGEALSILFAAQMRRDFCLQDPGEFWMALCHFMTDRLIDFGNFMEDTHSKEMARQTRRELMVLGRPSALLLHSDYASQQMRDFPVVLPQ